MHRVQHRPRTLRQLQLLQLTRTPRAPRELRQRLAAPLIRARRQLLLQPGRLLQLRARPLRARLTRTRPPHPAPPRPALLTRTHRVLLPARVQLPLPAIRAQLRLPLIRTLTRDRSCHRPLLRYHSSDFWASAHWSLVLSPVNANNYYSISKKNCPGDYPSGQFDFMKF
jgi:hypothetical protein